MNLKERLSLLKELALYLNKEDNNELNEVKQTAFEKNRWFTIEFIDLALKNIVTQYLDENKLDGWVKHYRLDDNIRPKTIGVVMAGNIPLVGFHDFLSVFISGHRQHIKLSGKDDALLKHMIEVMIQLNPKVKDKVEIMERLKGCDAYIATGSNNSSRYFHHYFGKYPSIIRSNKTSVAVIDGTETKEELELLAEDVYTYFGLGCRNVTKIYVPEGYDFIPLINAFKKYDYLADETKYKNNYDYNLALLILNNSYYMSNESLILSENDHIFSAVSMLHYSFYKDAEVIRNGLSQLENVQCIVGHGYLPFGTSQIPSLTDYADGVDTMQFLLSL
ncbi:MAG: acyl-CoA reductase [Ginsengibacter sp.]